MDRGEAFPTRPSGEGVEEPLTAHSLGPGQGAGTGAEKMRAKMEERRRRIEGMPANAEVAAGDSTPQPDGGTGVDEQAGFEDVNNLIDSSLFPQTLGNNQGRAEAQWSIRTSVVVKKLHEGLEHQTLKWVLARMLDSQAVECIIIMLVLADLALVTLECGIYHHFICVNGRLVHETPALASAWAKHPLVVHDFVNGGRPVGLGLEDVAAPGRAPSLLQRAMRSESLLFASGGHASSTAAGEHAPLDMCGLGACATNSRTFSMDGVRWRVEANSSELADLDQRFMARMRGLIHKVPPMRERGNEPKMLLICEDRTAKTANRVMLACDCLSVAILLVFMAEICSKLWVHPAYFYTSKLHMLDVVVVVLSLLMDTSGIVLYYAYMETFDAKVAEMLLPTVRLWRVVRIFHNAFSMWYRSTSEWKMTIRLQNVRLRKAKDTVDMLRTLTGLHGTNLLDLRAMVRNMDEQEKEIMTAKKPGFHKDPQGSQPAGKSTRSNLHGM